MKQKLFIFFILFMVTTGIAEDDLSFKDLKAKTETDCIFPQEKLGDCVMHMKKITSPMKGSAPAIEIQTNPDFKWEICKPCQDWGKEKCTYKYCEQTIPGTRIIFNITNKIDDVTYYKIDGTHPYNAPMFNDTKEAEFLERFIFFKFTATAAKGMTLFEAALDNYLYALDKKTKLLYTYGMPTDYKHVIGSNYIPLKWLPYELAPNTKANNLKFYEYDPVGFVSADESFEFFGIKTNVHIYDWWYKSITAGTLRKTVKKIRFMPRLEQTAEKNWLIRDAKIPVISPYRRKNSLQNNN